MKKYSEKYLDKYKLLENAIIGLEFEAYYNTSYYKTLENMNAELGVKVFGFKKYHPDFEPDQNNFMITPDLSGGLNCCELVTGAMDYYTAKYYLVKILKFIQKYGYTSDKTALHINLSFKNMDISKVNILKIILDTDEDEIYKAFPSRKNNIYAKSIKNMIPFKDFNFADISIDKIKNTLKYPSDKYFGINFSHLTADSKSKRLEFRYLGGKDYEHKVGDILENMDEFVIKTINSITPSFDPDHSEILTNYLNKKINIFKSFETYDNFLIEYPKIRLQVDQYSTYEYVNSVYPRFKKKLYEFFEAIETINDETIINYYTQEQRFEIVNANIKPTFKLNGFDFIGCEIYDGIFDECIFNRCEMSNVQIQSSKLQDCQISKSKIYMCDVEASDINDCYFENGYLNSNMTGGILRSGKVGLYANISDTTQIVTDDGESFFQTKLDQDNKNGKFKK